MLLWVGAALALGTFLRLQPVGTAVVFGDEYHSLRLIGRSFTELLQTFCPGGSGVALPLLQKAGVQTFGLGSWAVRAHRPARTRDPI